MLARPLRPVDLLALAVFARSQGITEMTARQWPRNPPETASEPYLYRAVKALLEGARGQRSWACWQDGKIRGIVDGNPRSPGLVMDVDHLRVARANSLVTVELLAAVSQFAANHHYRRVFLDAEPGAEISLAARRADFEHYLHATSFRLPAGFQLESIDPPVARPRYRSDDLPLFQLYCAAVPAPVRAAEAMTLEEWRGLSGPWTLGLPLARRRRKQMVWEVGGDVVGWLQITAGRRSQYLDLLLHPKYEDTAARFLRYALLQLRPRLPVYLVAREQQTYLEDAAISCGFMAHGAMDRFVRMLAVRVSQPALAQARMVAV